MSGVVSLNVVFHVRPPSHVLNMYAGEPAFITTHVSELNAKMPLKSRAISLGTAHLFQVVPLSMVFSIVPFDPLAHTTFLFTIESARRPASVLLCCLIITGFLCEHKTKYDTIVKSITIR